MERPFRVNLIDLATLLANMHRGAQLKEEVGFEDCERTLVQLTKDLSPTRATIDQSSMESALWSSNLLNEIGEFWSPTDETFEQFLNRMLRYAPRDPGQSFEFDKYYNLLRKRAK